MVPSSPVFVEMVIGCGVLRGGVLGFVVLSFVGALGFVVVLSFVVALFLCRRVYFIEKSQSLQCDDLIVPKVNGERKS